MAISKAQQIIKAYDDGLQEMAAWRSLNKTTARYFRPTYKDLTTDPTESEVALPNTSAGISAQTKFVSGVYSNTIAMGRGTLDSADPRKRDVEMVKRFYGAVGEKANDIVKRVFPGPYREALEDSAHGSVGVFYVHFNRETGAHEIITYDAHQCVWYEDHNGKPNKMLRGFEYTADQAVERFGYDNVGEKIQKAWMDESKANEKFNFIHCVRPRKKRNAKRKDVMNMPYESLYIDVDGKKIVEEGGYNEFRYVVFVMFKRRGQRTGYSPAMQALPSMRALVRGTDDFYDALEYKTNPVLFMSDRESVDNAKNLRPGDVRYARLTESPFLYGQNGDPQGIDILNQTLREEIRELHFLDLFQALEQFKSGERTAYEVAQIIAEKINLIMPIVHPLKAMFSRVFEIIAQDIIEYRMIDIPIPPELAGDEFDVAYTSRVDSQVSGIETENLLYAITEMVQAEGQLSQTLHSKAFVNIKSILDSIAKRRNLSPADTRTSKEYNNELARIQQEMREQMMAQADAQAAGNRDLTKKPEEGSEADVVARARGSQL